MQKMACCDILTLLLYVTAKVNKIVIERGGRLVVIFLNGLPIHVQLVYNEQIAREVRGCCRGHDSSR